MSTARNWCFTLNNWTDEEYAKLKLADGVKYMVIGKEVGEQGTPHLQGFVIVSMPRRLAWLKSNLSERAHWEAARGSFEQNFTYCTKEGDYEEVGQKPVSSGEAEKERWKRAREAAVAGRLEDIPDDIYVRYYRTVKEIKKDHMQKPEDCEGVTGVWIYGPPGIGKSHRARAEYPGAYLKMQNKWWDGYQGEDYVILDDFDSKEMGHLLKIWTDKYSFLAETKGGAIHIRPKKFIVTSNYYPAELGWDPTMLAAIERRFEVIHMTSR